MSIANPTGNFYDNQGLPDTTDVDINHVTDYMYEFIELFVGQTIIEDGKIDTGTRVVYPILYKSNETDFTHNGLGLLAESIKAVATEELNGMFELQIEYDSDGSLADVIDEEMIIKAKANDKQDEQLFRIYSITKNHENDNLIIDAQHITYDLANNFVEELKVTAATKKQVMEQIGVSTTEPHPFTVTSTNNTTQSSTSLYRTNPLQMIGGMDGSVLQIWGGQIERDNFRLVMHDRRGHDDGVLVTYAKNLTGLEAKFDMSKVITRIFPFKYVEASDNDPEKLITIGSVNGGNNYIDSPLINNYAQVFIEPLDLSNDESIENAQDLYNASKDFFNTESKDKPTMTAEVKFEPLWETEEYKDVAVLELVGMGDTVTVRHSKFNIDVQANVNRIEYDSIAGKNLAVDLGSVKANLTDKVNKVDDVANKLDNVDRKAQQAITSADGKNTNYYGPDEPSANAKEGDLWFKVVDGVYTRTYRFDGIEWQIINDMADKEAQDAAAAAHNRADDAYTRANQGVSDAQDAFDKAQESADDIEFFAKTISDDVSKTTLTAIAGGLQTRITDNEEDITTVTQLADTLAFRVGGLESTNLIPHDASKWTTIFMAHILEEKIPVKSNTTYTMTSYGNYDLVVDELEVANGSSTNEMTITDGHNTFTTASSTKYVSVLVIYDTATFDEEIGTSIFVQLEEGDQSNEWKPHKQDTYSQYSQLNNAINLRVKEGDVLGQINLEAGTTLIQNGTLILDADTTLVTGDFKIDGSANIKDASIGTAQIGTIDAAQASIINLNVRDLVGNYASFISDGFNDIGSQVKISSAGLTTYSGGLRNSLLNSTGHHFYHNGSDVGKVGTNNWVGDSSYRGLVFDLEHGTDYMAWAYRKEPSDNIYTTMLSWHRTSSKSNSGFNFSDHINIGTSYNLYLRTLSTAGYSNGNKHIQLQNMTWNGRDSVILRRASSGGGVIFHGSRATLISGGNASIEVSEDSTGNRVHSMDIWNRTYSGSANVYVTSAGTLGHSTSSEKYKVNISKQFESYDEQLSHSKKILDLDILSWHDKSEAEITAKEIEENKTLSDDNFKLKRYVGLTSEKVLEAGFSEHVERNEEGGLEGIEYDRMWIHLMPIIKDQQRRIEQLEAQNNEQQ